MTANRQQKADAFGPPHYFQEIKNRAASRWDQLEADPELAGPWHQLFKQVQSPRHILSELLQNADDAGATEASVSVTADKFVFEHNGEDFADAHFASICRFGYSNKRALHTIGFRGIGFKSTFSLGDRVELYTPTLAIAFERARFTEPHWIQGYAPTSQLTRIEVALANPLLRKEVDKNLDEWLKSPTSLLFFKSIRRLQIRDKAVHWQSMGPGPVANSEWMALDQKADNAFLLVRSAEAAFPSEALEEIKKERMISDEEMREFPLCRLELVLGAKGRLYVVLPTGVETSLPFACNAPFIQDPARLKIKDPEISPTNRWLLQRAGQLAADTMTRWLNQSQSSVIDRSGAYELLPDVDREANTLEGQCGAIVELAFAEEIEGKALLLTEKGCLVAAGNALVVPLPIFDIWPADQAMSLLDGKARQSLCRHVRPTDQVKLVHWNLVEEFSKASLIEKLRSNHLPRPTSWRQLLNLWSFIGPEVTGYYCRDTNELRIVPVKGKEVLYSSSEVVRLGEKKLLQSEEDWEFMAEHLMVLNTGWLRFLTEQQRETNANEKSAPTPVDIALEVLDEIGLAETSDVNAVIERVAMDYFGAGQQPKLVDCIRLAQIAAKLGVTIGNAFRYACADRTLRPIDNTIIFDEDGGLEYLLPEDVQRLQLLHPDYAARYTSCSREEWLRWISSGRSGLQTFAPLVQKKTSVSRRTRATAEARSRGLRGELSFPYVTESFVVEDWDFAPDYWRHWDELSKTDSEVWTKIAGRILNQRDVYWSRTSGARLLQVATTGSTRSVTFEPLLADWLMKLRVKPCLPDTRGVASVPADLLRRCPETESFLDVDPFVHGLLDRESTRPLLDLLGVRRTPTSPTRLVDRLRALSKASKAPILEVEKWYRRLDHMLVNCSTMDSQAVKAAFKSERLILAHDDSWVTSGNIYILGDEEDVPGAALVRPSVRDLTLWARIEVADRPSAELALRWLITLPSNASLSSDDARRVRSLLVKYPARIWDECGHWLNLLGEWTPVDELTYALSMQTLLKWSHLHDWVKRKTADMQRLPVDTLRMSPFALLPALSDHIEERLNQSLLHSGSKERRPWLSAFGINLARIILEDTSEMERVRKVASDIVATLWSEAPSLEVIPYLDEVPAGTPRQADVLWIDRSMFVARLSKAKLAKRVPEEIGRNLNVEMRAALVYAFERSVDDIKTYLEENFTLGPEIAEVEEEEKAPAEADKPSDDTPPSSVPDTGDQNSEVEQDQSDEIAANGNEVVPPAAGEKDDDSDVEILDIEIVTKPRPPAKPTRPGIMTRFAFSQGFKADGDDRFYHTDGRWIGRVSGATFPWECRSRSGDLIRYYYPKDLCLEQESLQIDADIWGLIDQRPELYSVILLNPSGEATEMTGIRLRTLCESGEIRIHPATYRLVYDVHE